MSQSIDLIRGYASALFQIADAEGSLDRVSNELFDFGKALDGSNELRSTLTDIAVPTERKQAVLHDLLGDGASDLTRHIIGFVVAQGRTHELSGIVEELSSLASERRSRVLGEVRSAVPLDDDQRERLGQALSKATGKAVDVKVVVDPTVVGGIYARVGDQVIDSTVRKRLQDLKEAL